MLTHWPQWTMLASLVFSFGHGIYQNGQKGRPFAWIIDATVCAAYFYVLYAGGFWASIGFGAP